jgi:hypothetical protein
MKVIMPHTDRERVRNVCRALGQGDYDPFNAALTAAVAMELLIEMSFCNPADEIDPVIPSKLREHLPGAARKIARELAAEIQGKADAEEFMKGILKGPKQ